MKLEILFKFPMVGAKIRNYVIRKEGGEKTSKTLRRYMQEKYNVSVDLYTYGSCFSPTFNTGGKVKVARYCSFGSDVHYFGSNHPVDHAVMSAYFIIKILADSMLMMLKENSFLLEMMYGLDMV